MKTAPTRYIIRECSPDLLKIYLGHCCIIYLVLGIFIKYCSKIKQECFTYFTVAEHVCGAGVHGIP